MRGNPNRTRRLAPRALTVALALALALSACSSKKSGSGGTAPLPAASGAQSLKGVCPDTVTVQTDWVPEAEHGAVYEMLGSGAKIDAARKRITGPLVAGGKDTGVRLEIRAGGPAIGFQQVNAQMYLDNSITLGFVNTDAAVQSSLKQPVVAVVTPLEVNPQIIMWDPKVHSDWHTIADIGQTNTKVLYFKGGTFMDYLIGSGILRKSQVDGSYDGSPATYVASGGKIAQQGFATSEPYIYEHLLPQWRRPVAFQLINDTGYPVYSQALSARRDALNSLAPCLQRLVPIVQQAQIDFVKQPDAVNQLIVKLNKDYKSGYPYELDLAKFTVDQELKLGIVGNGPDKTLGNFDMARIQRVINIVTPIFTGQKKPVQPGLKPSDLATNQFIDPSIGLT